VSGEREEHAAGTADRARDPRPESPDAGLHEQFRSVLAAGGGLITALRRLAQALRALIAAEARVLRASIAVVFLSAVALVAFSVSLWACVVALLGWAFTVATHSVGIALGILVLLHAALVAGIWFFIKRAVRHASFPEVRAELRQAGRELMRDVDRFAQTRPAASAPMPDSTAASREHPS